MNEPSPIRGRWTILWCPVCGEHLRFHPSWCGKTGQRHTCPDTARQVEVVPVPDGQAIERAALELQTIRYGNLKMSDREIARAVLAAALEPPE